MNMASEIVIRWLLEESGADSRFSDGLVDALYGGCADGEDDAPRTRDALLDQALATPKDPRLQEFIEAAVKIHLEIETLGRDARNLGRLVAMCDAIRQAPDNPLGRRISVMKAVEQIRALETDPRP